MPLLDLPSRRKKTPKVVEVMAKRKVHLESDQCGFNRFLGTLLRKQARMAWRERWIEPHGFGSS